MVGNILSGGTRPRAQLLLLFGCKAPLVSGFEQSPESMAKGLEVVGVRSLHSSELLV